MVVQFGIREHEWPGGSFRGFDVPAGTYTRDTAFAYRIADGRISERWAIRDDLGMLLQLGALRNQWQEAPPPRSRRSATPRERGEVRGLFHGSLRTRLQPGL